MEKIFYSTLLMVIVFMLTSTASLTGCVLLARITCRYMAAVWHAGIVNYLADIHVKS